MPASANQYKAFYVEDDVEDDGDEVHVEDNVEKGIEVSEKVNDEMVAEIVKEWLAEISSSKNVKKAASSAASALLKLWLIKVWKPQKTFLKKPSSKKKGKKKRVRRATPLVGASSLSSSTDDSIDDDDDPDDVVDLLAQRKISILDNEDGTITLNGEGDDKFSVTLESSATMSVLLRTAAKGSELYNLLHSISPSAAESTSAGRLVPFPNPKPVAIPASTICSVSNVGLVNLAEAVSLVAQKIVEKSTSLHDIESRLMKLQLEKKRLSNDMLACYETLTGVCDKISSDISGLSFGEGVLLPSLVSYEVINTFKPAEFRPPIFYCHKDNAERKSIQEAGLSSISDSFMIISNYL